MGIRWYGWSITSDEVGLARIDPWPVIRIADERHDLPGWTNTDFDKAWGPMQGLLGEPGWTGGELPRPAYALVAGNVQYLASGEYREFIGILDAAQVRAISMDLEQVTAADVGAFYRGRYRQAERVTSDIEYVTYYLGAAKEFVADAASRGHGAVYMIR